MHRFAVVAEGLLGEAFWITAGLGAFGPRVTIAVERYPLNHQATAGAAEFRGPVRLTHCS